MTPLVAVDLDRTLVSIDSFRLLVRRHLNMSMAGLLARRTFRLVGRAGLAEGATRLLAPVLEDPAAAAAFAAELEEYLVPDVLDQVKAVAGARVVVLSASPEAYVAPFAARLGFDGLGSHHDGGKYFHCYGPRKLHLLRRRYPENDYEYELGLGDSPSDDVWLAAFKRSVRI